MAAGSGLAAIYLRPNLADDLWEHPAIYLRLTGGPPAKEPKPLSRHLILLLMRLAVFRLNRNLSGGVAAAEAGSYPAISPLLRKNPKAKSL